VCLGASFCGAVWSNGLLSLSRYREILAINIFALIVGGALIAALVSVDGARGAAIATAAGELVLALLSGAALARAHRGLAPPLRIVPPVTIAAGLAIASTIFELPVLASTALACVIYVTTLLVLRALPDELVELLPASRRRRSD
jgi:O-antigen/teichoic acid export membrane protein